MMRNALSRPWLVFLVTVTAHGLATRGRAIEAVDTAIYVRLANALASGDLASMFNLLAVRWTKALYVVLLASARALSSDHWAGLMVALNVIASGLLAVLLVDLLRRATTSAIAVWLGFALYLGCLEVVQWIPNVLTDSLFCLTGFLPFYLVARRILEPSRPPRYGLMALALLLAIFSRPPGLVLIPLVVCAELLLVRRRVNPRIAIACALLVIVGAVAVRTTVFHDPSRWPFRFVKPVLEEYSAREKTGEVIYDRKESHHAPPRSAADHLLIEADRFVRFFQVTTAGFSRGHNVVNLAYFVPLYALSLLAMFFAMRDASDSRRRLVQLIVLWVVTFAFFHALTILDFDWRFRAPLMPHLLLLAAIGADALLLRISPALRAAAREPSGTETTLPTRHQARA